MYLNKFMIKISIKACFIPILYGVNDISFVTIKKILNQTVVND